MALLAYAPTPSPALPADAITPINNRDYTPAVRELLNKARKSIHITLYQARYYTEYPDTDSNYFINDLINARKRGVTVEVLVDTGNWQPEKNEFNLAFLDLLTTAGVKVWEDAPNVVNHEKVLCIDDSIAVVSSVNWTYYALSKNNEVGAVIYSSALNTWLKRYFYEHCATGKPRANAEPVTMDAVDKLVAAASSSAPSVQPSDLADLRKVAATDIQPAADRLFYPAVHEALVNATKSIDVVQRSFNFYHTSQIPGDRAALPGEPPSATNVFAWDLASAAKRGVKVRVLLDRTENMDNGENDDAAGFLRAHGVEVLQDDLKVQTHSKMLVVDDDISIIGSTNWSYEAIEQGGEVSVLIRGKEANKEYKNYVASLLRSAAPYVIEKRSLWKKPASSTKGH